VKIHEKAIELLTPLSYIVEHRCDTSFCTATAQYMREFGKAPTPGPSREIIADVIGEAAGKRGSKRFIEKRAEALAIFAKADEIERGG